MLSSRCIVLTALVVVFVGLSSAQKPINPNVNIDQLLRNNKFIQFQKNCLSETGPCDGIGKRMRFLISDVLAFGSCRQCSDFERINAPKVIAAVRSSYPDSIDQLVEKYAVKIAESGFNIADLEKAFGVTGSPNAVNKISTAASKAARVRTTASPTDLE